MIVECEHPFLYTILTLCFNLHLLTDLLNDQRTSILILCLNFFLKRSCWCKKKKLVNVKVKNNKSVLRLIGNIKQN